MPVQYVVLPLLPTVVVFLLTLLSLPSAAVIYSAAPTHAGAALKQLLLLPFFPVLPEVWLLLLPPFFPVLP